MLQQLITPGVGLGGGGEVGGVPTDPINLYIYIYYKFVIWFAEERVMFFGIEPSILGI